MTEQDETTITTETTIEGDAVLEADGCLLIPTAGLPAGSTITVTITIGPKEPVAPEPAAPQKPKYVGSGRINGGKS